VKWFSAALCIGALASCAAAQGSTRAITAGEDDVPRARAETVDVVRRSIVQRIVREAPTAVRGGVARLVTMVPLDEHKRARIAESVSALLSVERLENQVALELEKKLGADEIKKLGAGQARDDVAAVIAAATGADPAAADLEKFVGDANALPKERHERVKALVDASWSPVVVDKLTRAPVATAGRIAAVAAKDAADRAQLVHIADTAPAGDPRALVVAFAFLWRELDDATLDGARGWFNSADGVRENAALVDATTAALADVAAAIEARARE
jgi:hypothetical protein